MLPECAGPIESLLITLFSHVLLFQPTAGVDNTCQDTFTASSAATGVATGIFALVLQAK